MDVMSARSLLFRELYNSYYEEVINMTNEDVVKRASKAMCLLNKADEDLAPLFHELNGRDNVNRLRDGLELVAEARQELTKILTQINKNGEEDQTSPLLFLHKP